MPQDDWAPTDQIRSWTERREPESLIRSETLWRNLKTGETEWRDGLCPTLEES